MQKKCWEDYASRCDGWRGAGSGGDLEGFSGLSDSTSGEWDTITNEMRFCGSRCLPNTVLGQSNCSGSSG